MGLTTVKRIDEIINNSTNDIAINPTGKVSSSSYFEGTNIKLNNLTASVDPDITDDETLGYSQGSFWVNNTSFTQFFCSDATTGAAVWTQITGSGGGGGIETYVADTFESTLADDFTAGNNATFLSAGSFAGTLSDETSSPIDGDNSIKYEQASGSLNDWAAYPNVSISSFQRGKLNKCVIYATYDGDDDDIKFLIWDATNSQEIGSALVKSTSTGPSNRYEFEFYVPDNTSTINFGFQTLVENIGAILVFDNLEIGILNNPIQTFLQANSYSAKIQNNGTATVLSEDESFIATATRTGAGIVSIVFNSNLFSVAPLGFATPFNNANEARVTVESTSGLTVQTRNESGVLTDFDFNLLVTRQELDYNPVINAYLQLKESGWNEYTPNFVGFGTVTNIQFLYKLDGDKLSILGRAQSGTVAPTPAEISLPSIYEVSSKIVNPTVMGDFTPITATATLYPLHSSAGNNYLNVGQRNGSVNQALTARDGNAVSATGQVFTIWAEVPIEGGVSQPTVIPAVRVMRFYDAKTSGTAGGTFTSGSYQTRTINNIQGNLFGTLNANQISLPAGRYYIFAACPAFGVVQHKAKLYNVTDAVDVLLGKSMLARDAGTSSHPTDSIISGYFEIDSPKVFEIRHRCNNTQASSGFGQPVSFGDNEIYTNGYIVKII